MSKQLSSSDAAAIRSFYGRYARWYDRLATARGVARFRRRAVDALDLSGGETVLDLGCGTGANLGILADRVGPSGRVVGVDLTPRTLALAADRTADLDHVDVVTGDAMQPPIAAVDAVLATFLVGMLPDPCRGVDRWLDAVAPHGRVALLDLAPSRGVGAPLNPVLGALARLGAPPETDHEVPLGQVLAHRVGAAHDELRAGGAPVVERPLAGFVWLTAAGPS